MDTVEIVEVGPRDGLQNESTVLDPAARVDFVTRLVASGIRRLETVSFVHPGRVPQMAGAEEVMAEVPRRADDGSAVSHIGLVLNERGLERAIAADVDEANFVVITTEEFSRRNQGAGVDDVVAATRRMLAGAREAGLRTTVTISAAFGCPFAGEVSTDDVLAVVDPVLESQPDELALADTIGVGVPADVRRLVDAVRGRSDVALRAHFHNTRNTGYANAITAAEAGVAALDASSGGFGGCPFAPAATGNIATEDLVYGLSRSGFDTGLEVEALTAPAAWITARLGQDQPPALLGRAGTFPA